MLSDILCYVQSDMLFWHRFQDIPRYVRTKSAINSDTWRKVHGWDPGDPEEEESRSISQPFPVQRLWCTIHGKTVKAFLCAVQSQSSNHKSSMLIASRYRFLGFQQLLWGLLDYTIHCYHKFCLDLAHFPTRIAPASWHLFSFYRLGDL